MAKTLRESSKGVKIFIGVLFGLVILLVVVISAADKKETPKHVKTKTELVDEQFSGYDGSHHNLERMIKKNMNDPASYEHVETKRFISGDSVYIQTSFRGNNAFGGKVLNTYMAIANMQGDILSLEKQ